MANCDVAIIGAGPYGLSIAAHLKASGIDFRIFGIAMNTWMTQMPKGMQLKSEGFASSLYDPESSFTIGHYCKEKGIPYRDSGLPVALETFIAYGMEFQKRFVPELEEKTVVSVRLSGVAFSVLLHDGEEMLANKVIVAVGISYFGHVPPALDAVPAEFVSHSSRHSVLDHFNGRRVAVVGGGASALDLAALLHEAGAAVQLIARKPTIRFHDPPDLKPKSGLEALLQPRTGIGPGWKLYFCAYLPWAFRLLPQGYRLAAVKKILGPAPGWFIKEKAVGKFPFLLGKTITSASLKDGEVRLELVNNAGVRETVSADDVIAATGYAVDLRRLEFLDTEVAKSIRCIEQSPILSSNFECSVPGLYFVGASAANTFGPLMRFAYGARFTARRLSSQLTKSRLRKPTENTSVEKMETAEHEHVGIH